MFSFIILLQVFALVVGTSLRGAEKSPVIPFQYPLFKQVRFPFQYISVEIFVGVRDTLKYYTKLCTKRLVDVSTLKQNFLSWFFSFLFSLCIFFLFNRTPAMFTEQIVFVITVYSYTHKFAFLIVFSVILLGVIIIWARKLFAKSAA